MIPQENVEGSITTPEHIPSVSPSIVPTIIDDTATPGYVIAIANIALFFLSLVIVYLISLLVDKFCGTTILPEYLNIRSLRNNNNDKKDTIFVEMTKEERRNVLEKVIIKKTFEEKGFSNNNNDNNDNHIDVEEGEYFHDNECHPSTNNINNQSSHEDGSMNDNDLNGNHLSCSICLEAFVKNDDVTVGITCIHMFHTKCILEWMCSSHDMCPCCRIRLFDVHKFRKIAENELSTERFNELVEKDDPTIRSLYMGTSSSSS